MNQAAKIWLTSAEVEQRTVKHKVTIHRAAASGLLHSHQVKRCGPRRFHIDAVDEWVRGASEDAQKSACGCVHLQIVKRRGAA